MKGLEKQLEANASVELQMDYIDLARVRRTLLSSERVFQRFVDSSENTTIQSLHFLHLNGVNYTKRPLSAQEVYNIPQKMVVAELMVSMSGDNSQVFIKNLLFYASSKMIELAIDLVTHLNGVRCALIKRINEVVGKVNTETPAYPRSMLEFREITKYRPPIQLEEVTKPIKPVKIRDECEQAKKKRLPKRLLKFFCGNFSQ